MLYIISTFGRLTMPVWGAIVTVPVAIGSNPPGTNPPRARAHHAVLQNHGKKLEKSHGPFQIFSPSSFSSAKIFF